MVEIKIATEFSRYPGGRYRSLGKFSGEQFREDYLIPALRGGEKVIVVLDETEGYGSSFLEEAFGGLVRRGFDLRELEAKLATVARNPEFETYVDELWQYIRDESVRKASA